MKAAGTTRVNLALAAGIFLYLSAYLVSTDVFLGLLGATRYRIRLFQSATHREVFRPLAFLESHMSPSDREFSAEVASHASLPPPE